METLLKNSKDTRNSLLGLNAVLTPKSVAVIGASRSPGGTTQAAFEVLTKAEARESLVAAIRRAAERSRELSGG